jgi:hypothetical protein
MDRRGFLKMLGLGAGALALEQAIPLGRVWSFPKEIVVAPRLENTFLTVEYVTAEYLRVLEASLRLYGYRYWEWQRKSPATLFVKDPQRFQVGDRISIAGVTRPGRPAGRQFPN